MGKLYTIGHSSYDKEKFLKLIKDYNINYLLDVRSTPYSKYAPQYNADVIRMYLEANSVHYVSMGKRFGARQKDMSLYDEDGILDFSKTRQTVFFQNAVGSVLKGLNSGSNIVLMCTEKNPIECHRTILISKAFYDIDVPVQHILSNGKYITQENINNELLNMYFPDRAQMTLLDMVNGLRDDKELLEEAYRKRNKEIGYHIIQMSKAL